MSIHKSHKETLVNYLEHNYGYGKQQLATNLACLTFTACRQLACKFFQQALDAKKSVIDDIQSDISQPEKVSDWIRS